MRAPLRVFPAVFVAAIVLSSSSAPAARIDATAGKQYRITKQHGPWMIMVASLSETSGKRKIDGISPKEAADDLVYSLRRLGIPAYAFRLAEVDKSIQTVDRSGRATRASYRAQKESISVLAGNYKGFNDRVAQRTLDFLKSLSMKKLNLKRWEESGAFLATPGQPRPFSGAFLTMNPLLSQEEIAKHKRDPMLIRLNSGVDYSILENTGRYTLVVASFKGRSTVQVAGRGASRGDDDFRISGALDDAADRAWKVTRMLRGGLFQKGSHQEGRTFQAYVFHDRHESMVTVGSFESPQDPRLIPLANVFRAKTQVAANGKPFTTGESLVLPGNPPETVVFDPVPRLIEVPKIR